MARDAPFHLERSRLIHHRHLRDVAVTGRAADAFVDMNAVIEIDVIRQIVDSHPFDWLSGARALADRLQVWAVRLNLRVTVHAGLRRRDCVSRSSLDECVARATIYR